MDEDERLDYADRELGLMAHDMPYFMEGIKESLQKALDALPVPIPGPPPDGISIHEAIQVSSVYSTSPL